MRARLVVVLGLVAAACGSTASPNAAARHDILYVDRATDTAVLDADTGAERIALPAGIATADWSHYWSVEPSGDSTAVHAIDATSAATTRTFSVAGRFALPGVYGAAPSGLSANGQWLVLAAAHAPGAGATSRFAVVDLVNARLARTITAAGDYTFDAVSDDGRNVYLIEHLDSATQYRVRVANREGGGVAADPIVDIKVAAPSMNGIFHSAVADPHGQWQFGLYFNPTKGPFIHALNTTQLYAQCILALPDGGAGVRAMWSMVMDPPGGHLYVVNGAAGIVTDVGPTTLAIARWNTQLVPPVATTARAPRHGAVLSTDGTRLYVVGETGILAIQTADLSLKARYLDGVAVRSLSLSPDGQRLYVLAEDGVVTRLEAATGRPLGTFGAARAVALMRVETR